jgi:4'-phosphopantetheinyl transferase EntD
MTSTTVVKSRAVKDDLGPVREALNVLWGPEVVGECARPVLVNDQLYPQERAYIERAAPARQAQFGTARLCVRQALRRIGVAVTPVLANQDRSPLWPYAVRGSIAHTAQCCAAVVTRAEGIQGLGVDLESDGPFKPGLEHAVCSEQELAWVREREGRHGSWLLPLVFSAKEAFYKCQYPLTHSKLDFMDVELQIDLDLRQFSVSKLSARAALDGRLRNIVGVFRHLSSMVVTSALLRR